MNTRRVLMLVHPRRQEAQDLAGEVAGHLLAAGIEVRLAPQSGGLDRLLQIDGVTLADPAQPATGCELAVILGGDGSILLAAELTRGSGVPLLGVNLGHVGFLAEAERHEVSATVERIVARDYSVEERTALRVQATHDGERVFDSWALNEVTVEKASRERMIELTVGIDGRPLSTWGCDGVIVSTPTGSTAYAFSAGGPVIWPDVEALLIVPLSAHALFARPVVVGPGSRVDLEVVPHTDGHGVVWCDGRRAVDLPPGARILIEKSPEPVYLAHTSDDPFTDRLVAKFDLSIHGWRGPRQNHG